MRKRMDEEIREILERSRKVGVPTQHQKDMSYLLMVIRQREYELKQLEEKLNVKQR